MYYLYQAGMWGRWDPARAVCLLDLGIRAVLNPSQLCQTFEYSADVRDRVKCPQAHNVARSDLGTIAVLDNLGLQD